MIHFRVFNVFRLFSASVGPSLGVSWRLSGPLGEISEPLGIRWAVFGAPCSRFEAVLGFLGVVEGPNMGAGKRNQMRAIF